MGYEIKSRRNGFGNPVHIHHVQMAIDNYSVIVENVGSEYIFKIRHSAAIKITVKTVINSVKNSVTYMADTCKFRVSTKLIKSFYVT